MYVCTLYHAHQYAFNDGVLIDDICLTLWSGIDMSVKWNTPQATGLHFENMYIEESL